MASYDLTDFKETFLGICQGIKFKAKVKKLLLIQKFNQANLKNNAHNGH